MKKILKLKNIRHIIKYALIKEFCKEFEEINTKQNFCAGKGNAHINKRQLNQNYCIYRYDNFDV